MRKDWWLTNTSLHTLWQCDIQFLTTDAFRAWLDCRWVNTFLCAVGVQQAEFQCWLPRPPVALVPLLSAELVALLNIFSVLEVNRIFLKVFLWTCPYSSYDCGWVCKPDIVRRHNTSLSQMCSSTCPHPHRLPCSVLRCFAALISSHSHDPRHAVWVHAIWFIRNTVKLGTVMSWKRNSLVA